MTFPTTLAGFYNNEYIDNQETVDFGNNTHGRRIVIYDVNGNAITPQGVATAVTDGRKTVTTAGTREQLSSTSVPCKRVTICAETDNTGLIVVGAVTCVASLSTRRGIPLNAGDTYKLEVSDLNLIYLDSTINGDGVTFVAET